MAERFEGWQAAVLSTLRADYAPAENAFPADVKTTTWAAVRCLQEESGMNEKDFQGRVFGFCKFKVDEATGGGGPEVWN